MLMTDHIPDTRMAADQIDAIADKVAARILEVLSPAKAEIPDDAIETPADAIVQPVDIAKAQYEGSEPTED